MDTNIIGQMSLRNSTSFNLTFRTKSNRHIFFIHTICTCRICGYFQKTELWLEVGFLSELLFVVPVVHVLAGLSDSWVGYCGWFIMVY